MAVRCRGMRVVLELKINYIINLKKKTDHLTKKKKKKKKNVITFKRTDCYLSTAMPIVSVNKGLKKK